MVNKDKKQRRKERAREKKAAFHAATPKASAAPRDGEDDTAEPASSSAGPAAGLEETPLNARIRRERARAASDRSRPS